MEIRRCMKCMSAIPVGQDVCPVCGHSMYSTASESFALKPGTILEGKYLVGEMLGQGGFGITYIGFDLLLEQKVAIKEYFPMSTGMVSREKRSTVLWSSAMLAKTGAEKGFDSFLKEARKMAKLGGIPGVVGVKSVFIQNETAYIVMDFIQGQTLQKKLEKEGPMDYETCIQLLTPVLEALAQVHKHGIIHRDISPDNIMVQPDGSLVLLDLGAAKDLEIQKSDGTLQSSQLVAKHGFSPLEQYTRSGHIGTWTDVYAMAATIYYCCTGKLPPAAVERVEEDTLVCRPNLTPAQFRRLEPAMAISGKNRIQTMEALLKALRVAEKAPPAPQPERGKITPEPIIESEDFELWEMGRQFREQEKREAQKKAKKQKKKRAKLPKWADFLGAVLLLAIVFAALVLQSRGKRAEKKATPSSSNSGSVITRIEKNTNQSNTEAAASRQTFPWLGGTYVGEGADGVPEGEGTLTWDVGTYIGNFHNGYPQGTGTYTDSHGEAFYSVDWSFCGNSRNYLLYPTGKNEGCSYGSYTGMVMEEQACGYGYADIDYCGSYEGTFSYGYPQGTGTYHRKDGTDISGTFQFGHMEGESLSWKISDQSMIYNGMYLLTDPETGAGYRAGWGILEFEKGGTFYGEFQNNTVDGAGVYVYATISDTGAYNDLYGDNWRKVSDDTSEAGLTYYGLTLDGQWQGYGLGVESNGNYYLGEVSEYKRDGYGRYYLQRGVCIFDEEYIGGYPKSTLNP